MTEAGATSPPRRPRRTSDRGPTPPGVLRVHDGVFVDDSCTAREERKRYWESYLTERVGTYEYRTRRYALVADELERLGLADGDMVVDVGAGMCEFGRYLYADRGWSGRYVPVDGAISGVELEVWTPEVPAEFHVAVEVVEHVASPGVMLLNLAAFSTKGAVVTTPNPERVDVLALDRTHRSSVWPHQLGALGWRCLYAQAFNHPEDTLVGVYEARAARELPSYSPSTAARGPRAYAPPGSGSGVFT